MAAPTNILGKAREQTVFAVKETTKGTLAFPAAAAPYIITAGYGDMNQNPSFTDSEEVRNSRDVLAQFQDMTPAGAFSIPMYARPSGVAGDAPMGDVVFESLLGLKTVNAGTSVVYSPAMTKSSFSLWMIRSHTMFFAAGAVAESMKLSVGNKGGVKFDIGGSFLQMGWAGRDAVKTGAASAAADVPVYDASKYTVGARIQNVTKNDHATNGYTVTAVNTATNTLTVSPVLTMAWSVDDVIQPYLPAGTAVGVPLEARKTAITLGGTSSILAGLDINYDDKVKMLDDEINPAGYPSDYVENVRKTTGSVKAHFRQNDLQQFLDGLNGNEKAIVTTFGTVAGSKLQVSMTRCKLQMPKLSVSAPLIEKSVDYTALGTNGEDSISLTWL